MDNLQSLENVNGYKPMSNTHSLLIELSDCGSAARLGGKSPKWQDIKFNNKGEAYITHYGVRHYLDEFMKVY